MNDVMLLGILNQRYIRYLEVMQRLEDDQKYIEKLEDMVLYLGTGLFRTNIPVSAFTGQDSQWCTEFENFMNQLYKRKFKDHD